MIFSSLTFLCVFLPAVLLAYWVIPSLKARNYLLILASIFFYAFGEPVYVILMIASTLFNYAFGRLLAKVGERAGAGRQARIVLIAAIVMNLGFLGVFKYAGMFASTVDTVFGLAWQIPVIALPIGISFYTFQAISYVVDVYRGDVEASKNYSKVLLYISFFPQLMAGPIILYSDIEKQLSDRVLSVENVAIGMRRFCVGLGKKVLIANTMASVVDSIYGASFSEVNVAVAWIAALAYIMQIYFDFSGYSDMAIGLARMFGFHYKENFNYPYISKSIQEFWRRWHISLSSWFKGYLYIPLGGNRKGRLRTGFNKIVVFFCCGLWHGASWTFVIWGLFHGLFLLLEEYLPVKRLPKALGVIYTLLVVTIGFVIFRADTLEQGVYFITQMFTGFHFEFACTSLAMRQLTPLFITVFLVACVACTPIKSKVTVRLSEWAAARRAVATEGEARPSGSDAGVVSVTVEAGAASPRQRALRVLWVCSYVLALALLFLCMIDLSGGGYNPFIYFRF